MLLFINKLIDYLIFEILNLIEKIVYVYIMSVKIELKLYQNPFILFGLFTLL